MFTILSYQRDTITDTLITIDQRSVQYRYVEGKKIPLRGLWFWVLQTDNIFFCA